MEKDPNNEFWDSFLETDQSDRERWRDFWNKLPDAYPTFSKLTLPTSHIRTCTHPTCRSFTRQVNHGFCPGCQNKNRRKVSSKMTIKDRFIDNNDGTVTDQTTGLVWLKNLSGLYEQTWNSACRVCGEIHSGDFGLSDGSKKGDWRLPTIDELNSLIDRAQADPALPKDHFFENIQSFFYWSSTTYASYPVFAWVGQLYDGDVSANDKTSTYYVWPVRDKFPPKSQE